MFVVLVLLALLGWVDVAQAEPPAALAVNLAAAPDMAADDRAELIEFYALRNNRPVWDLSDDAAIGKTMDFINSVEALAAYHGLETNAYPLDGMRKLAAAKSDADKQKLELLITDNLLHLAHDLHGDAVDLDTLYTGWVFHRDEVDMPALVNTAITEGRLEKFFAKIAPQNDAYRVLAHGLQAYGVIAANGGWAAIAAGPALHPHDRSPRVTQLRARLAAEGYSLSTPDAGQEEFFDEALSKTLMIYQTRNGLSPDGALGGKTLEALNTPLPTRLMQIRANMERWRHMPENFPPDRYSLVNIPDFSLLIVEDGKEIYRGIVIDGRPDRQTPFIGSKIYNMLINPSWNVPVGLAKKDILPKLRKDPHYLEKLGFVIAGRDNDPSGVTINWKAVDENHFPYQLRQRPSDLNSLGQLKFNFANPFDVYMHGTPHQELFDKAERDFSSGCVRLEDPEGVAQILLQHNKDAKGAWTEQRISDEIDTGKSYFVPLTKPMPVYFLYWSVFQGDDEQINFRKDIYGYDTLLMNELKRSYTPSP